MKRILKAMAVAVVFLTTASLSPAAFASIAEVGETVPITGVVYQCSAAGSGMLIDTDDGDIVRVFGKGPLWYWQQEEVDFPEVGEAVTVYAFEITFSDGSTKLVIDSIDIGADGEVDIDLRDDDGMPLWRQHGKNIVQQQIGPQGRVQVRK